MKTQTNFADTLYETPGTWGMDTHYIPFGQIYKILTDNCFETCIILNDCEKYEFLRSISDKVAVYSGKSAIVVEIDKDGYYELLGWEYTESDIDDDDYK